MKKRMASQKFTWPYRYKYNFFAFFFCIKILTILLSEKTVDTTNIKSDLRALDEKVFTCRNELTLIRNENSRLESAMKGYSDKIPLPDLERSVKSLDDEVEELKLRLHDLKSAKTEVYTKQEKLKAYLLFNFFLAFFAIYVFFFFLLL